MPSVVAVNVEPGEAPGGGPSPMGGGGSPPLGSPPQASFSGTALQGGFGDLDVLGDALRFDCPPSDEVKIRAGGDIFDAIGLHATEEDLPALLLDNAFVRDLTPRAHANVGLELVAIVHQRNGLDVVSSTPRYVAAQSPYLSGSPADVQLRHSQDTLILGLQPVAGAPGATSLPPTTVVTFDFSSAPSTAKVLPLFDASAPTELLKIAGLVLKVSAPSATFGASPTIPGGSQQSNTTLDAGASRTLRLTVRANDLTGKALKLTATIDLFSEDVTLRAVIVVPAFTQNSNGATRPGWWKLSPGNSPRGWQPSTIVVELTQFVSSGTVPPSDVSPLSCNVGLVLPRMSTLSCGQTARDLQRSVVPSVALEEVAVLD